MALSPLTVADDLYLDLLKKMLTRSVFPDRYRPLKRSILRHKNVAAWAAFSLVEPALDRLGLKLCLFRFDEAGRKIGANWPAEADTMVGHLRLDNVEYCVRDVLASGIPGDFMETGVWRGGVCILMRAILKAYGDESKTVWVADSFEGLPRPDGRYKQDQHDGFYKFQDVLGVSLEEVQSNFARYGLLDNQVRFLRGWFKDTLPSAPIEKLAVLRLDGDMYGSTMDSLNNLYPKLSRGGYLIVDDYAIDQCKQAVDDYRERHGITDPIQQIDWTGVFWKKENLSGEAAGEKPGSGRS